MLVQLKHCSEYYFVCCVYRIVNIVTGSVYVGATTDMNVRLVRHAGNLKAGIHSCKKMQAEFDQHGLSAYRLEILQLCEPSDTVQHELRFKKMYHEAGVLINDPYSATQIHYSTKNHRPIKLTTRKTAFYWDMVIVNEKDCWGWKGFVSDGRSFMGSRVIAARYAYTLHHGPIPEGLHVRHSCNNPICTRPDHLSVGTQQDNSDDKIKAFRGPGMIASEEIVKGIRQMYMDGYTVKEIKAKYQRSVTLIIQNISFPDSNYVYVPKRPYKSRKNRKISPEVVAAIRKQEAEGVARSALAKTYGLVPSTVRKIVTYQIFPQG